MNHHRNTPIRWRRWAAGALAHACMLALLLVVAGSASAASGDTNRDRIPDRWEQRYGLSLNVNQYVRDQDRDGVSNYWEFRLGTHPRKADTDRDGIRDGMEDRDGDGLSNRYEIRIHLTIQILVVSPLSPDADGDGIGDAAEDVDGDGLDNEQEEDLHTDPCHGDSDRDGTGDAAEDADGDELPNGIEEHTGTDATDDDSNGNGVSDGDEDADGDGHSNGDESVSGDNPADADDTPVDDAESTSGDDDASDCPCVSYGGYVVAFDGRYLTVLTFSGEVRRFSMWHATTVEWYDTETGAYAAAGSWHSVFTPGTPLAELDIALDTGQVVDVDAAA